MTYLEKDSVNYETWQSLVMISVEYYNISGWDNLSILETKRLYYNLNISLDGPLFSDIQNFLEFRKMKIQLKKDESIYQKTKERIGE